MKTATITEAKNGLSALIDRVKAGESIVITDRGRPVAVLEPITEQVDWEERIASLERRGLARRPARKPDPEAFRRLPRPDFGDIDVVRMIIEERESSL
jgi:prevent-host-death family protein